MILYLTSRENERIKELVRLRDDPRRRLASGLFISEGRHLFEAAFKVGAIVEVYLLEPIPDLDEKIVQYVVTPAIMEKISISSGNEGIITVHRSALAKDITSPRVLYLDDINDPGNVGTILRSAAAFGYQDVIFGVQTCSFHNPKVVQASQGAIFELNIVYGDLSTLRKLKKNGYRLIATAVNAVRRIENHHPAKRHVLILGNERRGVDQKILKIANVRLRIALKAEIESLNVGVAAGVAMYELTRRKL